MAGDVRMSSVFCLKARPSTPMVLSLSTQSVSLIFLTNRSIWRGVDLLHFLEQPEIVAHLLGDLDEGAEVLGEAAPAEAQRGVEEPAANALVHAHAVGHFLHVGARGLAQHGQWR